MEPMVPLFISFGHKSNGLKYVTEVIITAHYRPLVEVQQRWAK